MNDTTKASVNTEEKEVSPKTPDTSSQTAPETSSKKKKKQKQIYHGQAHIQCTYNNTMITLSDMEGKTLGWSSAGLLGFKGAKKSTPYAATQVISDLVEKTRKIQPKELDVFVKGVGNGREAAIRALANNGFILTSIKDITPLPHNGCRPKRPRRV